MVYSTMTVIGIVFLLFSTLVYYLSRNIGHGLEILIYFLLIINVFIFPFGIIGLIITLIKPFIKCTEIGIDAKGKKYSDANDSSWFFDNLPALETELIKHRISELEQWRDNKISKMQREKDKKRFLEKFNKHAQKAFYCYIYRSGTRYTQSNYVKTPYTGTSEYWSKYYSIEDMKAKLHDQY